MLAAIIILSLGVVGALPIVWLVSRAAMRETKAVANAQRERDVAELSEQQTRADMKVAANELAREQTRHREDVTEAKEEIAHARELLRRAGATDPDITDERLRRVEARLAARATTRNDRPPGVPRAAPAEPGDAGESP